MTDLGGRKTYNDRLKVLMDFTLLKASAAGEPLVLRPEKKAAWGIADDEEIEVVPSGMAELQNNHVCDECGMILMAGQTVLGKLIRVSGRGILRSFFWPTCIGCFISDKGGYLGSMVAALVMQA